MYPTLLGAASRFQPSSSDSFLTCTVKRARDTPVLRSAVRPRSKEHRRPARPDRFELLWAIITRRCDHL